MKFKLMKIYWQQRLFPSFSQPQHIDLECCAALSHTPALLQQLFIYRVVLSATISSEHPNARSLTCGRIPELFKQCRPSANTLKIFLAHPARITMKFFFQLEYFPIYGTYVCMYVSVMLRNVVGFQLPAQVLLATNTVNYPAHVCCVALHTVKLPSFSIWKRMSGSFCGLVTLSSFSCSKLHTGQHSAILSMSVTLSPAHSLTRIRSSCSDNANPI